jgi:type II secretory pathway component PulF
MPLRLALAKFRDKYQASPFLYFFGHPLAKLFSTVLEEMQRGYYLDQAFSRWIPQGEMMLIRGGVKGGDIPKALEECIELIKAQNKIIGSLLVALSYPTFLMCALFGLILLVAFQIMPELARSLNPERWTGPPYLLYKFSSFVASPAGLVSFLIFVALIVLILKTLPTWTGPLRLYVEKIPPWSIYRLVVGSVWLFTLATMFRAKYKVDVILKDMLSNGTMRPWLAERVQMIRQRYRSDGNFGSVLLNLGMNFPDAEIAEDLAFYATLPNFHANLYDIAKDWLDDGVERINAQAKIIFILAICGIGCLLGSLVFAFASLQQQFGTGVGAF